MAIDVWVKRPNRKYIVGLHREPAIARIRLNSLRDPALCRKHLQPEGVGVAVASHTRNDRVIFRAPRGLAFWTVGRWWGLYEPIRVKSQVRLRYVRHVINSGVGQSHIWGHYFRHMEPGLIRNMI